MATEIQFSRDQIYEKNLIIRILFMLKSVNRENDYFSNNLWNIKNTVDKVNKNVTPSSAHKVKVSTIQIFEIIIILRLLKIILTEIMLTNYLKVPTSASTKVLSLYHLPCMVDHKLTPRGMYRVRQNTITEQVIPHWHK